MVTETKVESKSEANTAEEMPKVNIKDLNLYYGTFHALKSVNMKVRKNLVTALIGPSGCGKSTLLRCIDRMNDLIDTVKITGAIEIDGENVYDKNTDLISLRKRVGMVFQRPNPFPLSVYDNIAYGPRIHGIKNHARLDAIVEKALTQVQLWDRLKDRLKRFALNLSLEQQQRLCVARLVAVTPDVVLMDEPCSTLDPVSTAKIEELIYELKKNYTIVIVTHNMQQAARVSDRTGYMLLGELIEYGETGAVFTKPRDQRTEDYITGRFG